jgi:hypothetical protein
MHLPASRRTECLDTGLEGGLQLIAIAGNYGNGYDAHRSQDQGVFGEVLTIFFTHKLLQHSQHVNLLMNRNRLAKLFASRNHIEL